jgi:polyribonucleotide nucleotidyltransferase
MVRKFRSEEFGYEVEIGRFAKQADAAVWFQQGGTVVLATVVSAVSSDFPGFMPLTVDYRELFSAAGKIPGGYYKREGKPSDKEVLTSRLIDRAVRPLFPAAYFDQVQVQATVYSVDREHTPNVMALVAASLALTISKIPFLGPVGAVEMCKINGEWLVNPLYAKTKEAESRIVIAGTEEGICMVEGSANEISEQEFVDVLFKAHEYIKKLVAWQMQIRDELAVTSHATEQDIDWTLWNDKAEQYLTPSIIEGAFNPDKTARAEYIKEHKKKFVELYLDKDEEKPISKTVLEYVFEDQLKHKVTELIFIRNKRVDNRSFDQVRPISIEVGLLPYTHGSAVFIRGNTQALVTVTLGSGEDEQKTENLMESEAEGGNFIVHYNFPSFSVGEVRPSRGPGRREVGHGYLAASALRAMLPAKADFSYTIRIVADMLESDGSTSMATTCGSTMALMQAGVPIKKMVSGIAMGLLRSDAGQFKVLTDISGFEDAYGLMDFKVAGTDQGITAIQMDIKYKGGLSREVFENALAQAHHGRMYIMNEMKKVMDKPNKKLSDLVPKLVTVKIDTDKIGAIIGTGGKTIREITEKTKTSIDIEPDGLVKIFGGVDANLDMAVNWVKTLSGQIVVGTRYEGKIKRIVDFGMFVELVPGQDGLVHVSNIPRDKQKTFARDYAVNDAVTVEVVDYEAATGRIRLRILEKNK